MTFEYLKQQDVDAKRYRAFRKMITLPDDHPAMMDDAMPDPFDDDEPPTPERMDFVMDLLVTHLTKHGVVF